MNTDFNMFKRRRPVHQAVGVFLFVALLLSITACGPTIKFFDATPSRLCKGDSTTVSWKIKGDTNGILSAAPTNDLAKPTMKISVPSEGSRNFMPEEDSRYTIAARSDEKVFSEYDVLVFDSQCPKDFGEVAKRDTSNADVRVAVIAPRQEKWPDNLRVETVSSTFQRELTVIHEGHQITLSADGSPSEELRGTKVNGEWTIKTKLLPNEMGENPSQPPPTLLGISISFHCEQGG